MTKRKFGGIYKPFGPKPRAANEVVKTLLDKAIPRGDCLICHLKPSGEGYIVMNLRSENKLWLAHRLIYSSKVGPIGDLQVLHSCDVRSCINPKHLFLGTQADNIKDMMTKGRLIKRSHPLDGRWLHLDQRRLLWLTGLKAP